MQMVAIFTGAGAGTERGSGTLLGNAGLLGSASFGSAGEQIFVNAATGNLVISRSDEFLVGRGPDAAVWRTYNSKLETGVTDDDGMADNWQVNLSRIDGDPAFADSGSVTRIAPDGSRIVYTWRNAYLNSTTGAFVATDGAGAHDTITRAGSGLNARWVWTDGDTGRSEEFGKDGQGKWRLTRQVDSDGKALSYDWNNGVLVSITSLLDGTNPDGSPRTETISYSTTSTGQKSTTRYVDLVDGSSPTIGKTYYDRSTYTRAGVSYDRLTITYDLSPKNRNIDDGKIYQVTYLYDLQGRIVEVSESDKSCVTFTYDATGRVETITTMVDAGVSNVVTMTYVGNSTTVRDTFGKETVLTYTNNAAKRLTRIETPPAEAGGAAQVTTFSYDPDGNLLSTTDSGGHAST